MANSLLQGFGARAHEAYNQVPEVPEIVQQHLLNVLLAIAIGLLVNHAYLYYLPVWKARRAAKKFAKSEALRKAKRTKEAMDKREVRLREILGEIITDGILDRQVKEEISDQEMRKLMAEASQKLGIPELVPLKTRSEIVKREVRRRLFSTKGYNLHPVVLEKKPPPLPVASTVSKYWRRKPVTS